MHALLSHEAHSDHLKKAEDKMYVHILMSLTGPYVWSVLRNQSIVYSGDSFQGGSRPMGFADPKDARKFVFLLLNLAISHFLEVHVPLTHSQGPSQSPFVNRTMFYNSPLSLR